MKVESGGRTQGGPMSAEHAFERVRERWLDKLWTHLFDGDAGGLMSPGQLRREHRNRAQVRQFEMRAILEAEADVNKIHRGLKRLDERGNLIDTPHIEPVETHAIIENTAIEQAFDVGLDSATQMLRSAVREVSVLELERSLNLRRLAILAETEILEAAVQPVSVQALNAEWMARWREAAVNVFHPELQLLWAKMLVHELAQPDSYALGVMASLRQVSAAELDVLKMLSAYRLDDFIFDARGRYFNTIVHQRALEYGEDLGLLNAEGQVRSIESQEKGSYYRLLVGGGKALAISGDSRARLLLPVCKLSRVGRQLLGLLASNADLAYLFDLANYLKHEGFQLALGDWTDGRFVERMQI